ncbi:MAG: LysM peptidoglycan-binding domain-containing protein [Bacilli bacterium]|nr:LysM peptidoglycan-binding domain-containing protein [Bacilli bacterium]
MIKIQTYIVKRGDTLYGISNQFGVSVTELASLNGVNAATLQIGQTLLIPTNSGENPDNMFYYTVKKGDTLYNIARVYGTSVESIKNLNYLTSNDLYIGQVLRIPEIYTKEEDLYVPEYINYTVKRGDSLYSIARIYNTTIESIMQDNGLKTENLTIGQNLKIRKKLNEMVEECFGEEYMPIEETNKEEYIVQKGDTLYSIAKKYNLNVQELINTNNLETTIYPGQILYLPVKRNSYTVVRGDSLYSIAKKFNTTVDAIKKKNNLTSNLLVIGQILQI